LKESAIPLIIALVQTQIIEMEYPYKPPKHLQHLADFGDDEVTKTVAGKCPNCGSDRLRYLDEFVEDDPNNIVACDDCRNWCYENELDIDDSDSDDQDEDGDFDDIDEDEKEDDPRRASFLALGANPVEPMSPMDPLGPRDDELGQVDRTRGYKGDPLSDPNSGMGPNADAGLSNYPEQIGNVLPFADPNAARTDLVGGKGANLATLTQAGLPVPPGFSIPADVFQSFVPDPQHLIELTQQKQYDAAQHYVMAMDVPRDEILAAFDALGYERVAVRSSAVAEDSADASYAGRQATLLQQSRDGGHPVTDKGRASD
jgi:hypothetical protein